MVAIAESWWQWVLQHKALLAGLSLGFSIVLVIASLVGLPWFIARLPTDYFSRAFTQRHPGHSSSAKQVAGRVVRNAIGVILALAGLVMLVLPGQGIITLLVALTLLDFPGKRRVERWFVGRPKIRSGLDWVRRRAGKPPFEWEDSD